MVSIIVTFTCGASVMPQEVHAGQVCVGRCFASRRPPHLRIIEQRRHPDILFFCIALLVELCRRQHLPLHPAGVQCARSATRRQVRSLQRSLSRLRQA
eukprot:684655-Prymnesium_polylepis.2